MMSVMSNQNQFQPSFVPRMYRDPDNGGVMEMDWETIESYGNGKPKNVTFSKKLVKSKSCENLRSATTKKASKNNPFL